MFTFKKNSIPLLLLLIFFCRQSLLDAKDHYLSVIVPPTISLSPKHKVMIPVILHIHDGFHIQSNPPGAPGLIPTEVILEISPQLASVLTIQKIEYPPGNSHHLVGMNLPITVYSETTKIEIPVTLNKPLRQLKNSKIKGKLIYQACSDKTCFQPSEKSFVITLD